MSKEQRGSAKAAQSVRSSGTELITDSLQSKNIPGAETLAEENLKNRTLISILNQQEANAGMLSRKTGEQAAGSAAQGLISKAATGSSGTVGAAREALSSNLMADILSGSITVPAQLFRTIRQSNPAAADALLRNWSTTGKKDWEAAQKKSYILKTDGE